MKMKTDKQVLDKAIKLALIGGWNECGQPDNGWGVDCNQWSVPTGTHLMINHCRRGDEYYHRNQIIYSHDFAKALWGDKDTIVWADDQRMETLPAYKFHLQQMVISPDPIDYLRENMPEGK